MHFSKWITFQQFPLSTAASQALLNPPLRFRGTPWSRGMFGGKVTADTQPNTPLPHPPWKTTIKIKLNALFLVLLSSLLGSHLHEQNNSFQRNGEGRGGGNFNSSSSCSSLLTSRDRAKWRCLFCMARRSLNCILSLVLFCTWHFFSYFPDIFLFCFYVNCLAKHLCLANHLWKCNL